MFVTCLDESAVLTKRMHQHWEHDMEHLLGLLSSIILKASKAVSLCLGLVGNLKLLLGPLVLVLRRKGRSH